MLIRSYWYGPAEGLYSRMARVLAWSAKRFHSDVRVAHRAPLCESRSDAFVLKARHWTQAIGATRDPLILLDADMVVRAPLDGAFDIPFDIGVTSHKGRINSGALFIRPSRAVSDFFVLWEARTKQWCQRNTKDHIQFGDQDALVEMLVKSEGLGVVNLPMHIWNSTQYTWPMGIAQAKILHVKSDARKGIQDPAMVLGAPAARVRDEWLAAEGASR